jgi:hypothetical protein
MPHLHDNEPDAPFAHGSDTSREAAERIDPHSGELADRVLAALRAAGRNGATCDELEVSLALKHQTVSARIRHLVLSGFVLDSNHRRQTRSGRAAVVWISQPPPGGQGSLF